MTSVEAITTLCWCAAAELKPEGAGDGSSGSGLQPGDVGEGGSPGSSVSMSASTSASVAAGEVGRMYSVCAGDVGAGHSRGFSLSNMVGDVGAGRSGGSVSVGDVGSASVGEGS